MLREEGNSFCVWVCVWGKGGVGLKGVELVEFDFVEYFVSLKHNMTFYLACYMHLYYLVPCNPMSDAAWTS